MIFSVFRRLWGHLDIRTKSFAFVAIAFTVVSSFTEALGVGGLVLVMRIVESGEAVQDMPWIASLMDAMGTADFQTFAIIVCIAVAVFYVFKNIFLLFASGLQAHFGASVRVLFMRRLMQWYLNRPYAHHLKTKPSELVHLISTSSEEGVILGIVPALVVVTELLAITAVLSVALWFYPLATLMFLVILGVIPGLLYILLLHRKSRQVGVAGHEARMAMHSSLFHSFGSLREIRTAEKETYFQNAFDRQIKTCANLRAMEQIFIKAMPPLVECFIAIAVVLAAIIAITQRDVMGSSLSMMALFGAAALRLLPSIFRLSQSMQLLSVSRAPLGKVLDELDAIRPEDMTSPPAKETFEGLALEGVTYTYPGASEPAVRNLSLSLKAGEMVGLVGPSGAGKTTVVDLMLGILHPEAGQVRVNGVVLEANERHRIRLSYIPQDIYLLDDTLRRNIAFGEQPEEIDAERMKTCVAQACLEDLIADLPQGLDTMLGERGAGLSGGQRQRVALARALYNKADLLILDEATSALDAETEGRVVEAIRGLRGQVTCVMIAHRLSSIEWCDRLILLEEGGVQGVGTFSDLTAAHPRFARMVQLGQTGAMRQPEETF